MSQSLVSICFPKIQRVHETTRGWGELGRTMDQEATLCWKVHRKIHFSCHVTVKHKRKKMPTLIFTSFSRTTFLVSSNLIFRRERPSTIAIHSESRNNKYHNEFRGQPFPEFSELRKNTTKNFSTASVFVR